MLLSSILSTDVEYRVEYWPAKVRLQWMETHGASRTVAAAFPIDLNLKFLDERREP